MATAGLDPDPDPNLGLDLPRPPRRDGGGESGPGRLSRVHTAQRGARECGCRLLAVTLVLYLP